MVPLVALTTLNHAVVFRHSTVVEDWHFVDTLDPFLACCFFNNGKYCQLTIFSQLCRWFLILPWWNCYFSGKHLYARHGKCQGKEATITRSPPHLNVSEVQCDLIFVSAYKMRLVLLDAS